MYHSSKSFLSENVDPLLTFERSWVPGSCGTASTKRQIIYLTDILRLNLTVPASAADRLCHVHCYGVLSIPTAQYCSVDPGDDFTSSHA